MQTKLDGMSVTSTMEVRFKVKTLSSLRETPKVNEKNIHLNSLKLFNRLIILAQRNMSVDPSLEYELTPFPLSLFSNKNKKMIKTNKAEFLTLVLRISQSLSISPTSPASVSLLMEDGFSTW